MNKAIKGASFAYAPNSPTGWIFANPRQEYGTVGFRVFRSLFQRSKP